MLDALKTIGSMAGLLSIVFLIYRYAKARPIACFAIKEEGPRTLACISITNVADYDIAIRDTKIMPEVYFLTEDLQVHTLLEGASRQRPSFILRPHEERLFMIAHPFTNGIAREVTATNVTFKIVWRRCNVTWLPQLPLYVRINTMTIRQFALPKT